jgi:hypothetical protein
MKITALAALSAILLFVPAAASVAQERTPVPERPAARARSGDRGARLRALRQLRGARDSRGIRERMQRARGSARGLEITEEQRAIARECKLALKPLADETRPQARAILEQARELRQSGDREALRNLIENDLRPLLRSARERAEPLVQPLLRSLTPDQRARIDATARRRGRQLDDSRLSARLALLLARRSR